MSSGRGLGGVRPGDERELAGFVRRVLGFRVARRSIASGSAPAMAYLAHAFFETQGTRDCVVWANRGGGKTQLGAIATLLDLLFKPGVQVRILGGSLEQSSRMYSYLREMLEQPGFAELVDGRVTGRRVRLWNGSCVEVLSQSERSVRGQRIHKLRCDEVEMFDVDVWRAAQLTTQSGWCGDVFVRGGVEVFSTMHRPFGLMRQVVDETRQRGGTVFRWGLIDTLERCAPERVCDGCALWAECGGRAKSADGFLRIDDAIAQKGRVDELTWRTEMLCESPSIRDVVYSMFDRAVHVRGLDEDGLRAPEEASTGQRRVPLVIGGVDFGFRSPTVVLWGAYDASSDLLHVFDELVVREQTAEGVLAEVAARPWPRPAWFGADVAGHQRNEHTGLSTIALWKQQGFRMRTKVMRIAAGIATVSRRLRAADGRVGLVIDPRCEQLIEALERYHYRVDDERVDTPVKDGPDHAADALRYMVMNLDRGEGLGRRGY